MDFCTNAQLVRACSDVLQANAKAKFDETIEVAINLGTNPKRGDQAVRGTAVLPYGTGKSIRIAAFAEGEDATAAKAAGRWILLKHTPYLPLPEHHCSTGTLYWLPQLPFITNLVTWSIDPLKTLCAKAFHTSKPKHCASAQHVQYISQSKWQES